MIKEDFERMRDQVNELHTSLIGTPQMPGAIPLIEREIRSHNKRIKSLENWRYLVIGMAMAVGYIIKLMVH